MSESILAKYIDSEQVPSQQGVRCLNLINKQGNSFALSYNHFHWANFKPSVGLQVHFATHTVTMMGRNLAPLYEAVLRFDLPQVTEIDEKRDLGGKDETVVTKLYIMQKPEGTPVAFEMPEESGSGTARPTGSKGTDSAS